MVLQWLIQSILPIHDSVLLPEIVAKVGKEVAKVTPKASPAAPASHAVEERQEGRAQLPKEVLLIW